MSTLLKFQVTSTVPSAGPTTTYRDLLVGGVSAVQVLTTDSAAGPDERPFREGGTGPAISFYSERVTSQFTLTGAVTFQLSGFASDAAFTGRFRVRLSKITDGGSNVETFIGMADATADFTTTTTLFSFSSITPSPAIIIAPRERFVVRVSVVPTGAGGTSFGTGTATHRYNLISSGMTLTENVTFLPNGTKLILRRTANTGIGTFRDLSETQGTTPWIEARVPTQAGGTEIQWTQQEPVGTIAVTEVTAAAIASTSNASSYASASFTPVANRLYLLAVAHTDAAAESTVPTVSTTTGLAFVQAGSSIGFNTVLSPGGRVTLFRAMKPSGLTAGTYTVNFTDASTGCAAILAEVTGIKTTGQDGADAIRDVTSLAKDNLADPEMTNSVPPAPGPLEDYNGYYACFGTSFTATTPTAGSGYTGLSTQTYSTPTLGLFAEWRADNDVRLPSAKKYANATHAASSWGMIQAELVAEQTSAAVVEWISPRVKKPFYVSSVFTGHLDTYVRANDGNANCGVRVKVFHRTPSGTETLVYTNSSTSEMATRAPTQVPWAYEVTPFPTGVLFGWTTATGTVNQEQAFAEDDRIVLRAYLINMGGTMAAGYTANFAYDHDQPDVNHDANIVIYPDTTFKLESDPAAAGSPTPDGLAMGGVGN